MTTKRKNTKERTPEITHKIMSSIKSKDTEPELMLRKALWNHGLRYRIHYKKLPGRPDITFSRAKLAVFCDGDFWHGHNWALRGYESFDDELNTYSDYWKQKLTKNVHRDQDNNEKLKELGWTVLRLWESDIRNDLEGCVDLIIDRYNSLVSDHRGTDGNRSD